MNRTVSQTQFARVAALAALAATAVLSAPAQQTNQTGRPNPNDFSAFRLITERNIFDPNRRPMVAPRPAPKIVDSFALVGTMSLEGQMYAVFNGNSADYHKVLEDGGKIAGFSVTNINMNAATLALGTNDIVLDVGMQLRRNEDGRWAAAGQAQPYGTSLASTGGSGERRHFRSSRGGSTGGSAAGAGAEAGMAVMPDTEGGPPPDEMNGLPGPPGGAPGDVVARMMMRRAQQERGAAGSNENDNTNSDQP